MKLPEHRLMDSVHTNVEITRKNFFTRLVCPHDNHTDFVWIDHRGGPGWMSDTYQGKVCTDCGHILKIEKTY